MEQFLVGMFFGAVIMIVVMSLIMVAGDWRNRDNKRRK